jgi:hypothetical protein
MVKYNLEHCVKSNLSAINTDMKSMLLDPTGSKTKLVLHILTPCDRTISKMRGSSP